MKGFKTPPEKVEEVKALSVVYSPKAICGKVGLSLRTVYTILRKKDSPVIEAKREEMRVDVVERMWKNKDKEILQLKDKLDMLMDGVSQEKMDKARLMEITTAYAILFDKRQLLMGKPTAIRNATTVLRSSPPWVRAPSTLGAASRNGSRKSSSRSSAGIGLPARMDFSSSDLRMKLPSVTSTAAT